MSLTHIEHIGIAVKNLDEAVLFFERTFGIESYATEIVPDQKARTAFFKIGETKIELLASLAPDGPIGRFIEKKGEGIHHIAFASDSLRNDLAEASKHGVQLIDEQPRRGAEGLDIAFLHPKSTLGVLMELCAKPR